MEISQHIFLLKLIYLQIAIFFPDLGKRWLFVDNFWEFLVELWIDTYIHLGD